MALSLEKGQKISLQKQDGSSLTQVKMGLGWDVASTKSGGGGFLGGLFGGGGSSGAAIDLDASVVMFSDAGQPVDVVYFGQLNSKDGSIRHSGDNLTGAGDGDDEVIHVNLASVPANIKSLVFTVSSFRGQTFETVQNAFCRLIDAGNNGEIARYNLSSQGSHTALIVGKLYRHNGAWKMHAIGEVAQGRTFNEIIPQILPHL